MDLGILLLCIMILVLSFIWYHKDFQKPRSTVKRPVWLELFFYQVGKFLFVLPFLGAIYQLITWSPRTLKAVRNSTIVISLSNLSFSIYMVHAVVIKTKLIWIKSHSPLYFYDLMANFLGDLPGILFFSLMAALLIELPCSSLWTSYVDGRFLKLKRE